MGTPEMIAWEEPWRKQYPLVVPLRSYLAMLKAYARMLWRTLLPALISCLLILWLVHVYLPDVDLRSSLWFCLSFLPRLFLGLLFVPLGMLYVPVIIHRSAYTFVRPFVEVTRGGVRVPAQFFPFAKVKSIEVVEANGRAWLSLTSGHVRRRLEIPPSVDLPALKTLLQERDQTASKCPKSTNENDSFGRFLLAVLAMLIAGILLIAAFCPLVEWVLCDRFRS